MTCPSRAHTISIMVHTSPTPITIDQDVFDVFARSQYDGLDPFRSFFTMEGHNLSVELNGGEVDDTFATVYDRIAFNDFAVVNIDGVDVCGYSAVIVSAYEVAVPEAEDDHILLVCGDGTVIDFSDLVSQVGRCASSFTARNARA